MEKTGLSIVQKMLWKRSEAIKEARAILDIEKKENRSLTSGETQKYGELIMKIEELRDEITEKKKLFKLEGVFGGEVLSGPPMFDDYDGKDERNKPHASEEYRKAFWNVMKSSRGMAPVEDLGIVQDPSIRSMAIQTNQAGGVLVPLHVENELVKKLKENNVMRQISHILPLEQGDRRIPIVADDGEASWLSEGQSFPESNVLLDHIMLGGYKMGRITQVSEELMNDSVVNVEDMVTDSFVKSFAELEEEAFINGNGTTEPTGVLKRATLGVTGKEESSINSDELYDLYYSLKRPYRQKAVWLTNDQSIKLIRQLKTADGQYIWQPGFGDEPDRLLGRPVMTSPFVPVMGKGERSILFGDFSYYSQ